MDQHLLQEIRQLKQQVQQLQEVSMNDVNMTNLWKFVKDLEVIVNTQGQEIKRLTNIVSTLDQNETQLDIGSDETTM